MLNNRINDFLNIISNFKKIYYEKEFQNNNFIKQIGYFLNLETDYILLDNNYDQLILPIPFSNILNYLHVRVSKLNIYKLNPITFNSTNKNYFIQVKTVVNTEDYSKSSGGDTISVFIIENAMTNISYLLLELIN